MAKSNLKSGSKAAELLIEARSNPYVQRVIADDELRKNIFDAFGSLKSAYRRVSNGKGPATRAIAKDRRVQQNLRQAAESLKTASEQLRAAPKRRKSGFGKFLFLAILSGGAILAVSEGARKAVLDMILGKEEEFEYESTTSSNGSTT